MCWIKINWKCAQSLRTLKALGKQLCKIYLQNLYNLLPFPIGFQNSQNMPEVSGSPGTVCPTKHDTSKTNWRSYLIFKIIKIIDIINKVKDIFNKMLDIFNKILEISKILEIFNKILELNMVFSLTLCLFNVFIQRVSLTKWIKV